MKQLQLLLVLVCLTIVAHAQQLTEQQAMDRALQFLSDNTPAAARGLQTRGLQMKAAKVEAKSIYAFNVEGGGYIIASGDSRALPVLGYSDSGSIDWDQLPANMKEWLKSYDQAMATLGNRQDFKDGISLRNHVKTRAPKAAIEPLIKTTWHQHAPYWNKTPLYEGAGEELQGKQCITGCVATAMAQVMNYYQWPKTCPEIPAYDARSYVGGEEKYWHVDGLPSTTFDWDHMLDNYWVYNPETNQDELVGTEAEQDAVATLMRHCGQAVYTNYSPNDSGTSPCFITEALVKYFGYDDGARTVTRTQYGVDEWEDLIYGELEGGHPVIYSGVSDVSGHEFICDGYDGQGLFHFNWGWGGRDDGYFALSLLDPAVYVKELGYLGFILLQEVAINVRPAPEGYQYQRIIPAVYLSYSYPLTVSAADSAYFAFSYDASYSGKEVIADYAFGTCSDDGTLTPLFTGDPADSLVVNSIITDSETVYYVKIDSTAFEPGEKLTLYPMLRFRSEPGAEWMMPGSKQFCIYAGRADNGQFFLYSCKDLYDLEIVKAEFRDGGGEPGLRSELVLTIRNHGEADFVLPVWLFPEYYGNVAPDEITADTPFLEGEMVYSQAYLRPGEEAEVPFRIMTQGPGTVHLWLMLYDGTLFGETYVQTATGINSVLTNAPEDRYFDLQGRRLQGRPAKKGLFIRNNRKVIVK